jgi:hypothetical protein
MIDRNNIIEAAEQAFANINTPYSSCMKVGFQRGVNWFKHAIWHGTDERPEEGEQILYLVTEEDEIVDAKVTITALYDFIPWNEVARNFHISKWCYLADILPKGGK